MKCIKYGYSKQKTLHYDFYDNPKDIYLSNQPKFTQPRKILKYNKINEISILHHKYILQLVLRDCMN